MRVGGPGRRASPGRGAGAAAVVRGRRGAMGRGGHPDDTDSGDEEASYEASRAAGQTAGPCGAEKEREGEDGSAPKRSRAALGGDPSSSPAFAEVWRPRRNPPPACVAGPAADA